MTQPWNRWVDFFYPYHGACYTNHMEEAMEQNLRLLIAIRERGMRQVDFAKEVGDHFTFVSRVINGWANLDDARKTKYAKALGKNVDEIFKG